jgi:chemotaxis protein methyltransferase CheR
MAAPITAPDFDYIRTIVKARSAIVLEPGKEYLAQSRLEPVARLAGLPSIAHLVAQLRSDPRSPLHGAVIDAMTTNETSFFRDVHPFESLRTVVLPQLIARHQTSRTLNIWCAAASSGQEPYTVAMVIREHFPALDGWNVKIIATDLSPTMLERTRLGWYSDLEVGRGMPLPLLHKWFTRDGAGWSVDPRLRAMVVCRPLNLVEPWPAMPPLDLVFLRNVLIYFDLPTKQAILQRVRRVMSPDGHLLLGGSETTLNIDASFERVPCGKTSWYRPTGTSR